MAISAGSIVAIGECMLELRENGDGWHLGQGGDVFNTALCLARLGEPVGFMTALGDDRFSKRMLTAWAADGLDVRLVLRTPDALPGLYAIETDPGGERSFHYWRDQAAVRKLFRLQGVDDALAIARCAKLLFLSGITLALFDQEGRAILAAVARAVRDAGGTVAFDPNFRPRLWSSKAAARSAIASFAPLVSCALTTFEDEAVLHGDTGPDEAIRRWRAWGANELVIKLGPQGCMLADGRIIAPAAPLTPLDTTGAGDAFNAGYLHARRNGRDKAQAVAFGNHVAGRVIAHPGAIPPRDALPVLLPTASPPGRL